MSLGDKEQMGPEEEMVSSEIILESGFSKLQCLLSPLQDAEPPQAVYFLPSSPTGSECMDPSKDCQT